MLHANKGAQAPLDGRGLRIGIVQARFNEDITDALAAACLAELAALGVASDDITHLRVPGALEVPVALQALASALVMLSLKRACTIPIESFLPLRLSAAPFSAPNTVSPFCWRCSR